MAIKRIGRYKIRDQVGKGGMGVVYKAFDPELDRFVAIKLISPDIEVSQEILARFLREARSVAMFNHANIVSVYDVGELKGHPYIVMEYIEGQDLREIIEEQAFLPFEDKIEIMAQVCRGLAYAHRFGVVHRDINPRNIRISAMGEVKILDFGIARIDTSDMTRPDQQIGTPAYMSPEQVDQNIELDCRSDLFSAGVVLYQLITGRRPFEADTISGLYFQIISQPVDLSAVAPACSPELATITEKALAKEREERYADGDQMADAIVAFKDRLACEAETLRRKLDQRIAEHDKRLAESERLPVIPGFYEASLFQPEFPLECKDDYGNLLQACSRLQESQRLEVERRQQAAILANLEKLAQQLFNDGKRTECLQTVKKILAIHPAHAQALNLGKECQQEARPDEGHRQSVGAGTVPSEAPRLEATHPAKQGVQFQIEETLPLAPPPQEGLQMPAGIWLPLGATSVVVALLALVVGLAWPAGDGSIAGLNQGALLLQPVPWGRVESILRVADNAQMLDPAQELHTPCLLSLPPGKYRVRLSHPDYGTLEFMATVAFQGLFQYKGVFAGFDLNGEVEKEISRIKKNSGQ